jgi:APA family basic amino acid/polyamine antiporter
MSQDQRANPDALLSRELGVRQFAANIFNYTVGSGIFVLPAIAVMMLGTAAPLAYVACAIVMTLVLLCFAENGSRVSATGGSYAYVETALGPMFGFIAGCLVFTTGLFAASGILNAFVQSLFALFGQRASGWAAKATIALIVLALVGINLRGVRQGARVLEGITLIKLLPLVLFVCIGVFFVKAENLEWTSVPDISAVLGSAGIIIFAFAGIEGATIPSGEVKNVSRTVPLAILLALGGVTLLYLAVQFVALGIMGLSLADTGRTPLAEAAGIALGPTARTILIAAAVVSMFGYLSANMLSEPRGLFAMSRDGFLPSGLARVHPVFRTPNVAIVVYGTLVLILAVVGTFEWLTRFSNLAALSLYFLTAVSTLRLRKLDVRSDGEPFVIRGGPLVPILACVAIVWLAFETLRNEREGGISQLYALLATLAIVLTLYAIRSLRYRPQMAA